MGWGYKRASAPVLALLCVCDFRGKALTSYLAIIMRTCYTVFYTIFHYYLLYIRFFYILLLPLLIGVRVVFLQVVYIEDFGVVTFIGSPPLRPTTLR